MQQFKVYIFPTPEKMFFTTFVHPLTKKKIRKNFKTKVEADEYKKQTEIKFRFNKVENYQELTIEELLVLFVNDRPKTPFTRRKSHLFDFIETFGEFKIDNLTTDTLKAWLDQIQSENNLKEISMRGLKCEIDTFFNYLIQKEIISESPLKSIYYKKHVPPILSRNLLTEDETTKLLNALMAYSPGYLYPVILMFAKTAAKTSEVLDLVWNDIDLEKGIIHFKTTKSSKERKLPLSDELLSILKKKKQRKSSVFLTYYREPFTKIKLTRTINEFKAKKLYHGQWNPMDLRHSFAVNFLMKGGEMRELQKILGHDNIFDTKKLYGEVSQKRIIQTVTNPFENI